MRMSRDHLRIHLDPKFKNHNKKTVDGRCQKPKFSHFEDSCLDHAVKQ